MAGDPEGVPQFDLVAEQVAKVNPDLVARDAEGKPYTVRYEAVNAMLLNEFPKEHHKGEQQDWKQLLNSYRRPLKRRPHKSRRSATSLGHKLLLCVSWRTINPLVTVATRFYVRLHVSREGRLQRSKCCLARFQRIASLDAALRPRPNRDLPQPH
jgi:hypothetical protein